MLGAKDKETKIYTVVAAALLVTLLTFGTLNNLGVFR
jgi:hypothetical protein